jgi:Methyltransferase FkbM domain
LELIGGGVGLAKLLAPRIADAPFTLIDIGCGGGLDPAFRAFEPHFRAIGFDPNLGECRRLAAAETNAAVRYVGAFLEGNPDAEIRKQRGQRSYVGRNPWARLAVCKSIEVRDRLLAERTAEQLVRENLWGRAELADVTKPIFLPAYVKECGFSDIDFIKIDVDGPDFEILDSMADIFTSAGVLGVGMEVNWVGTDHPSDHAFHNTDRFLRKHGFDLFGLTVRPYAAAALPMRYAIMVPAQNLRGRPLQGDALYLRDLCSPEVPHGFSATREKIIKLAGLFDLFQLQDHAAELLVANAGMIGDVKPYLDLLVTASDVPIAGDYETYMRRFLEDDPSFYPPKNG